MEILTNTGAKLWSKDDYSNLWLDVFEQITGTGGKSNIRLIDEAIGDLNSSLDGYYLLYENDRLYICKDNTESGTTTTSKLPVSLIQSDGKVASSVDGTTITIDENGIVHGTTIDDAFSLTSENPVQNKVVKAKFDEVDQKIKANETVISSNTTAIETLNGEGEGSVKKTVTDEIAKVVADAPESLDTLKEISDWISSHESDASAMNSAIQKNKTDIETLQTDKVDKEIGKSLLADTDKASYDDAVLKAHSHDNKSVLDKFTESDEGNVIYNGNEIKAKTDSRLSLSSENPVQNKIVTEELNKKVNFTDIDAELSDTSLNSVQNKVITTEFNKKVNTTDLMATEKNGIGKPDGKTITADANGTLSVKTQFSHNIPRIVPKDITSYYSDGSLWYRLNGTNGYTLFEDIYVGDYIKMSRPISAYNQDQNYQLEGSQYVTIAGIDTMWGNGDTITMAYHHLVMIPGMGFDGKQHFGRSRMNPTHTTEGGYIGSEMCTTTIGTVATSGSTETTATINQQLYAEFGSHLKTTRELLSNSLNATGTNRFGNDGGCSNNWSWYDCQAVLMSEVECYGSIVWSSSGFDVGSANTQLPLFTYNTSAMNNRSAWYWLKGVASASNFCCCGSYGYAICNGASYASIFVRPRFVIAA